MSEGEVDLNKLREELELIKAAVMTRLPFIASLLGKVRIYYSSKVSYPAAATIDDDIILGPEFLNYSINAKIFALAHEVLHIAFRDIIRGKKRRYEKLWYFICEAVNNTALNEVISIPYGLNVITMYHIRSVMTPEMYRKLPAPLEDCSKDDIYAVLKHYVKEIKIPVWVMDHCSDGISDKGELIQEGDSAFYRGRAESEEREEAVKDAVAKAHIMQKQAGRGAGALERLVERLLQSQVPWQTLFRSAIREGLGKTVLSTWRRPSRRFPALPGLKRLRRPTCWVEIDSSGSISQRELESFLTEAYSISKLTDLKFVVWDAEVQNFFNVRGPGDFKKVWKAIRGYGGTEIQPTLKFTLENMRHGDLVVVLTDGEIWDVEEPETKLLAEQVRNKASTAIFVTTSKDCIWPGWKNIRLRLSTLEV